VIARRTIFSGFIADMQPAPKAGLLFLGVEFSRQCTKRNCPARKRIVPGFDFPAK